MDLINLGLIITPLIFLAALLFSSVGHGGASAYLAVMALAGIAPETMRPAALILNIIVSSIAIYKFYQVKAFSWQLLLPLVFASMPFAFLGGRITLPENVYKPIVGAVLIFAAWQVFSRANQIQPVFNKPASKLPLLGMGAGLGFLSGLTGIGGGVFLSPLLILLNWAETKVISGVAAAFILINSASGLAGVITKKNLTLPEGLSFWVVAVIIGGLIGAELGSRRLANPTIRKLLALILVLAGAKMLLAG